MAKFKREVIRCAEENGNLKTAAIFGVDESNVRLWWKHTRQRVSEFDE
jgi:transposase-like protein